MLPTLAYARGSSPWRQLIGDDDARAGQFALVGHGQGITEAVAQRDRIGRVGHRHPQLRRRDNRAMNPSYEPARTVRWAPGVTGKFAEAVSPPT